MKSLYDIISKDKETKDSPALSSYMFTEDDKLEFLSTNVIPLNLLFSGRVDGGIPLGRISMISAPSMLGKSFIAYGLVKRAQKRGMHVAIIDTERAFSFQFAKAIGIDIDQEKLVVLQENSIEDVAGIVMTICNEVPKNERKNLFFVIDSWGALVTSKTLDNALEGNDAADFTIPKKKNNLSNILLNTKATYFVVNHIYDSMNSMGGDLLSIPGGRKIVFNSDCVVLGKSRAKEKDADKEIIGHLITAETYKSRHSKEKSKLQFRIKNDGGLDVFFGILDDAVESGVVANTKPGWYNRPHIKDDKGIAEKNIYTADFWGPVFKETQFKQWLENKYTFTSSLDINKEENSIESILSATPSVLATTNLEEKKSKK
jgi:RecA/RadA recombinase